MRSAYATVPTSISAWNGASAFGTLSTALTTTFTLSTDSKATP